MDYFLVNLSDRFLQLYFFSAKRIGGWAVALIVQN